MVPGAASSIRRFCPPDIARFLHRFNRLLIGLWVLCGLFPQTAKAQQHAARDRSQLVWDSLSTTRFIAVHGRRASVLGYSNNGLEMWAYPVQILKAYRVSFRAADTTTEVDGPAILRRITYSPESITRTYLGSDFIVREKLFVPLDEPGAIISYDVESNRPLDIVVRFAPVLDLMWPASLGGQEINWDAASSSYVLSEPTRRFTAAIGSADIIAHDETSNSARRTSEGQPSHSHCGQAASRTIGSAKVIIAASVTAGDPTALAKRLAEFLR